MISICERGVAQGLLNKNYGIIFTYQCVWNYRFPFSPGLMESFIADSKALGSNLPSRLAIIKPKIINFGTK